MDPYTVRIYWCKQSLTSVVPRIYCMMLYISAVRNVASAPAINVDNSFLCMPSAVITELRYDTVSLDVYTESQLHVAT